MRKVLGIASVFIMMLSVAAFANQFAVEESVLAAGRVDVEECGQVQLNYVLTPISTIDEEPDTPDGGIVTSVGVFGGDECRYDDGGRDNIDAPTVQVMLYDDDLEVIDSGEAPFTTAGGDGDGTVVGMDGGDAEVTQIKGTNVRIFDRDPAATQ